MPAPHQPILLPCCQNFLQITWLNTRWSLSRQSKIMSFSMTLSSTPTHVSVTHVMHILLSCQCYQCPVNYKCHCIFQETVKIISQQQAHKYSLATQGLKQSTKQQTPQTWQDFPDIWSISDSCKFLISRHLQVFQTRGHLVNRISVSTQLPPSTVLWPILNSKPAPIYMKYGIQARTKLKVHKCLANVT